MSELRHRRGRHVRPGDEVPGRSVRRLLAVVPPRVMLGAIGCAGLMVTFAFVAAGPGRAPGAAVVRTGRQPHDSPALVVRPESASGAAEDPVLAYYRLNDGADVPHIVRIVWSGWILRIYTDLPGTAGDSRTALAVCATAAAYLRAGGRVPMVFVHARRRDGYTVLANKMNARDSCRLNSVP